MKRRTFIAIGGTAGLTGLAGCVSELGVGDDDNDDDESDADENGDDEHGAVQAVESYMAAAADEDIEAMSEAMHSRHPFDPVEMAEEAEDDEDREFNFDGDSIDDYEVELADEAFGTEEIRENPYVEFWFQGVDLEALLEGEEAVLVDVETELTEDGETVTETETYIALTEDGEWTVFLEYEEPPEVPEDDPVEGEEYRIVEDFEFDETEERAVVDFDRSPEIEVEEVSIYSSSLETENTGYGSDDVDGFPITRLTTEFDPAGDEIVVTATVDGEVLVVHREEYEP